MTAFVANVVAMAGIVTLAALRPGFGIGLALALGRHTFPDRVEPLAPAAPVLVAVAALSLAASGRGTVPRAKQVIAVGLVGLVVLAGAFRQNTAYDDFVQLLSDDKALFLTTALIPLLLIVPAMRFPDVRADVFRALIGIPLVMTLLSIATGATDPSGRAAVLGGGPITLATACGFAILILLHYDRPLAPDALQTLETPLRFAAGFVLVAGVILSGSRQPLLSLLIVVGLSIVAGYRKLQFGPDPERALKRAKRLRVASMIGMGLAVAGLAQLVINDPNSRLALLADDPTAELRRSRLSVWFVGIDEVEKGGLGGSGFGSFALSDAAPLAYPHNMVLELLAETGLIVGSFVLVILALAGWSASQTGNRLFAILALYAFLGTNFSGDLYNSRYFFFFLLSSLTFAVPNEGVSERADSSQMAPPRAHERLVPL